MSDNITLHRAAEQARSALSGWANHGLWAWPESALQTCKQNTEEALVALDAALAEPEPDAIARAVETEREACAEVCEKQMKSYMSKQYTTDPLGGFRERFAAEQCAAAIRARGSK